MKSQASVIMRGDGGQKIGMGHIMRLISISQVLKGLVKVRFALVNSDKKVEEILNQNNLAWDKHNSEKSFFSSLKESDVLFIDNYSYKLSNLQLIKDYGCKIISINDFVSKDLSPCDVVINHTPGYEREDFKISSNTKLLLGPEYCMIRRSFVEDYDKRKISEIKNITISLGHSFTGNLLNELLEYSLKVWEDVNINILQGSNYVNESLISNRVSLIDGLKEHQMVNLFDNTDLAILPLSSLYMEAKARGVLVAGGYFVDNQKLVYERIVRKKMILGVGNFSKVKMSTLINVKKKAEEKLPYSEVPSYGSRLIEIKDIVKKWL